jgi:hypothetical protein
VRPEELCQRKILITLSGIEPATLRHRQLPCVIKAMHIINYEFRRIIFFKRNSQWTFIRASFNSFSFFKLDLVKDKLSHLFAVRNVYWRFLKKKKPDDGCYAETCRFRILYSKVVYISSAVLNLRIGGTIFLLPHTPSCPASCIFVLLLTSSPPCLTKDNFSWVSSSLFKISLVSLIQTTSLDWQTVCTFL